MRKKSAYTLVETIVAALFIGIALITIASAFTNSSHILQRSRHTLTALGYLQDYEEKMRNKPFSSISSSAPNISSAPLTNPSFSITVESYYSATDIKKVSLDISWDEAGKTIHKKTATLVTDGGINPD